MLPAAWWELAPLWASLAPPSLNLHVHFHLLAVDAVFEKHGDGVRMHEAPPPAKDDVADVARRVHDRALVWLRRHRYLDDRRAEDRGNEAPAETPVDALARLALAAGTFLGRPFAPREHAGENLDRKEPRFSARHNAARALRAGRARNRAATVTRRAGGRGESARVSYSRLLEE